MYGIFILHLVDFYGTVNVGKYTNIPYMDPVGKPNRQTLHEQPDSPPSKQLHLQKCSWIKLNCPRFFNIKISHWDPTPWPSDMSYDNICDPHVSTTNVPHLNHGTDWGSTESNASYARLQRAQHALEAEAAPKKVRLFQRPVEGRYELDMKGWDHGILDATSRLHDQGLDNIWFHPNIIAPKKAWRRGGTVVQKCGNCLLRITL